MCWCRMLVGWCGVLMPRGGDAWACGGCLGADDAWLMVVHMLVLGPERSTLQSTASASVHMQGCSVAGGAAGAHRCGDGHRHLDPLLHNAVDRPAVHIGNVKGDGV